MINWLKYRWLYFVISGLVISGGVYHLVRFGLKPAIDFTGGSLVEFSAAADLETVRPVIESQVEVSSLQQSGDSSYILRTSVLDEPQTAALTAALSANLGGVEIVRSETVGPVLGKELIQKTIIGLVLAVLFILAYLAYRFKDKTFGICAVLAMLHDTLVIVGIFSILGVYFGVEVDSLFVTALLTILSFSVHDTIVLYDRIRENKRKYPGEKFINLTNRSISETMTRSVNNSLTIIFMLLALFVLGGDTTKWFIFALLIGTISGTYSSPFVAVPLLTLFKRK
jgi:preprotein translocase subunit SecF